MLLIYVDFMPVLTLVFWLAYLTILLNRHSVKLNKLNFLIATVVISYYGLCSAALHFHQSQFDYIFILSPFLDFLCAAWFILVGVFCFRARSFITGYLGLAFGIAILFYCFSWQALMGI